MTIISLIMFIKWIVLMRSHCFSDRNSLLFEENSKVHNVTCDPSLKLWFTILSKSRWLYHIHTCTATRISIWKANEYFIRESLMWYWIISKMSKLHDTFRYSEVVNGPTRCWSVNRGFEFLSWVSCAHCIALCLSRQQQTTAKILSYCPDM